MKKVLGILGIIFLLVGAVFAFNNTTSFNTTDNGVVCPCCGNNCLCNNYENCPCSENCICEDNCTCLNNCHQYCHNHEFRHCWGFNRCHS